MFIPTFAAVLLTSAAVAPQQPAGQTLRHIGSVTPSELVTYVSQNSYIATETPATEVAATPATPAAAPAAAPVTAPTVVNAVQTYSYYKINGRLYLMANPVSTPTVTYTMPTTYSSGTVSNYTPVYSSNGTVYYSTTGGCANGQCPNATPTYTFSSCPNGRCPNAR